MDKQNTSIEKEQNDFKNAQIFVTEEAAKRLKAVMSAEGKNNHFVRMSVDSGGCSGMNYKMDFDDHQKTMTKYLNQTDLKWSAISKAGSISKTSQLIIPMICLMVGLK